MPAGKYCDLSMRATNHSRSGRSSESAPKLLNASPHRANAFAACRYIIERVKQIAPIWKHEFFVGGDVWIEGATAHPEDEVARQDALKLSCA